MRASVAPLGERQSVARIGSHATSIRSFRCGYRAINCSAAEAPRRQVGHVGESNSTTRGTLVSPSKAVSNSLKFQAVSVNSGDCPCGTDEGPQRYAATKRSSAAITPAMVAFLFIFLPRQDGLQETLRSAEETESFRGRQPLPPTTVPALPPCRLTAHCVARRCCQNPNPISTTENPSSYGRSAVKSALAAPAPSAAAKPSGRQQLREASELRIAPTDAEMPVPCFTDCPPCAHHAPLAGSFPLAAHPALSNRDTTCRTRNIRFPIPPRHRVR